MLTGYRHEVAAYAVALRSLHSDLDPRRLEDVETLELLLDDIKFGIATAFPLAPNRIKGDANPIIITIA
ncbi:hypothetical protein EVAR_84008_1 [Eumeta japonica]|uniref:Uncharacterized protein n=1 Tax=Eumeta variegata TaxID=151549 RepID=A0A4C1X6M3_EUMVA|nr:hypothetical protein EVAR_84008_1 [Eumeta japonica]